MNTKIINALFGYFETLYHLNQKLIKVCGVDVIDDFENTGEYIIDIIQNIPRLIPYSYNKDTEKLTFKNSDGLLEYNEQINYLNQDYNDILKDNYDFLEKIRKVRNKYQHKMHGIRIKSSGSGSQHLFDYTFEIDENKEEITLCANSFIKLVKRINILFSKMALDVKKYVYDNQKTENLYYRRIARFEFTDFNKIYESDLLRMIGVLSRNF